MRVLILTLLVAALGCDRGPAPATPSEPPSASSRAAEPSTVSSPGVHGGSGALPAGHPSTANSLPPGHPPTAGAGALPTSPRPASSFDPANPSVGGVRWSAEAPLLYRAPESSMRAAEYVVGENAAAVMSVFYFPGMGGTVNANVERWVDQFTQPDGRPSAEVAQVRTATSNGLTVTTVDVTGDFGGGMGAPAQTGQRLLGAIVSAPDGPVFFKLMGPAGVVETAGSSFGRLVESVAPAR